MSIEEYFENTSGHGIISTADSDGKVNSAIYGRPHFISDGTIAFIMLPRLTHHNLQSNLRASYLFIENGERLNGVRIHLTKIREEVDSELLYELRRVKYGSDENTVRYIVFFKIDSVLPLVGKDKSSIPFGA